MRRCNFPAIDAAKERFPGLVTEPVIPVNVRIADAPIDGKPVREHAPSSSGAQAYIALAKELYLNGQSETRKKLAGWDSQLAPATEVEEVAEESKPKYKRKTYLVNEELIERHKRKAKELGLEINELLRYIMEKGLERLDSGEWTLDLRPRSYTINR